MLTTDFINLTVFIILLIKLADVRINIVGMGFMIGALLRVNDGDKDSAFK